MITMYSKPNCVHCDGAKAWLLSKAISYSEVDISQDTLARAFVISKGHVSVPQLYVGDDLLVQGGYAGLRNMSQDAIISMITKYHN